MLNIKSVVLIICIVFPIGLAAQVYSADAQQEGNNIVITYILTERSDISVRVSTNGGKTFSSPLKSVSGDVGKNISTGQKRIVWKVLDEYESFSFSEVCFSVDATPIREVKKKSSVEKTPFVSNIRGWEYTIPIGITCYFGSKRVGIYSGIDLGLGYNTKLQDKDYSLALTIGPKIGLTSNAAWIVGVGASFNCTDFHSVNSLTDFSIYDEFMFNFVLETGFVLRVSKLLFSARCQYMLPHSVVVPLVGVGLTF